MMALKTMSTMIVDAIETYKSPNLLWFLRFLYFVVLILASYLVLARVPRLSFAKALQPNCNLHA